MLLLYNLWDDWPIFMISGSNQQLQQQLEYTLLKPDYHSWWISKMQSGCEDTLEERYAITFCFKLGKMPCNESWIYCYDPEFPVEACWLSQTQEGQTEQIHPQTFDDPLFWQHWHDLHALGSHWTDCQQGILCWGFKGLKEEIPSEEASTLQIGSVAFPSGQCTSPQLHPCHRLFEQDGHQDTSSPPNSPDLAPCDFWLFPKLRGCRYETIEEMKRGCDEGHWHAHRRRLPWGLAEGVGTVQEAHCSQRRLLWKVLEFHLCTINKSAHMKKVWKFIEGTLYIHLFYLNVYRISIE